MDDKWEKGLQRMGPRAFTEKLEKAVEEPRLEALRTFFAPQPGTGYPGRSPDEEFTLADYAEVLIAFDVQRKTILPHEVERKNAPKLAREYVARCADDLSWLCERDILRPIGSDGYVLTQEGKGMISPRQ